MVDSDSGVSRLRRVRSYVQRQGRMTERQRQMLAQLWPRYGVEKTSEPLRLEAIFGRSAPCVLEIGFGMGDSLIQMAKASPEQNFIGIEVHLPGVARLLRLLDEQGINNVRVINHDAVEVLGQCIASGSLAAVHLFFPDPWPKKRHHKRRLVQSDFMVLVADRLCGQGVFHMATDWEGYAHHAMVVASACAKLRNANGEGRFAERPDERPLTKFEQRGQRLGHGVWDLCFVRENAE